MGYGAIVLRAEQAASGYVLHVVPANGGGVDRYVRDVCTYRPPDCILHVVSEQCVFEQVASQRVFPIDQERYGKSKFAEAIGTPGLLHVHSTVAPAREIVALLCSQLDVNYVVSLHDVEFAAAAEEVGAGERRDRLAFVRQAAGRVVPSKFISDVLTTTLDAELSRQLVENGVDALNEVGTESGRGASGVDQKLQVAVVGAVGPHKGLNFLRDVALSLPPAVRVVIIGYADGQLTRGWFVDDRIWVHGAFEPSELTDIVRRYGCQIAFFPNRKPESYCYALSDAWCAGLPALGPDVGAIGERIQITRAGWTYDVNHGAPDVATTLLDCLSDPGKKASEIRGAVSGLMSRTQMVSRLSRIYESAMKNSIAAPPQLHALESLAANHLNGKFFRSELQKLSGDLAFAQEQLANANAAVSSVTREYEARGAWISSLETRLDESQREIARIEAARILEHERAVATQIAAHAEHESYAAKLQQDVIATLETAQQQQRAIATYERALAIFPRPIRRWIMRRAGQEASAGKRP